MQIYSYGFPLGDTESQTKILTILRRFVEYLISPLLKSLPIYSFPCGNVCLLTNKDVVYYISYRIINIRVWYNNVSVNSSCANPPGP